ncbi:MAG: hypothetical protein D6761_08645 [Candidatus Dadabacteria bacterium]|nr:MAG: hypothetical protein D6761_08645 [Candidatus Dadabacteria bacterium]
MKKNCWGLLVAAAGLAFAGTVHAKSTDFELFDPPGAPEASLMTERARTIPSFFTVGAYNQFEQNPGTFARNGQFDSDLVLYRWQMRVVGTIRPLPFLQAGVDVPFTLLTDLQRNQGIREGAQAAMNDMLFRARMHFGDVERDYGTFAFGGAASVAFPTGNADKLAGVDKRFAEPSVRMLIDFYRGPWRAGLNLGIKERERTELPQYGLILDDQFYIRLSAARELGIGGDLRPIVFADYAVQTKLFDGDFFGSAQHNAHELFAGVELHKRRMTWTPGLAMGLSRAFGVPTWRMVLGMFFGAAPEPIRPHYLDLLVQSPEQEPIAGALVVLDDATGAEPVTARTAQTGLAHFDPVKPPAVARIDHPYWLPATAFASQVPATVTVALQPRPVTVEVRTVEPNGAPVTVAIVRAADQGVEAHVDQDATARLSVEPGAIQLSAAGAGYQAAATTVNVRPGQAQVLTLVLRPVPKAPPKVSVEIVDERTGEPVPAGQVRVFGAGDQLLDVQPFRDGAWSGQFQAPGAVTFEFVAARYFPAKLKLDLQWNDDLAVRVQLTSKASRRIMITEEDIFIADKVYFRTGSAEIDQRSHEILDELAQALIENPQIRKVEIAGHTDSVGRHAANVRLSQARAAAVRKYLIDKGVEPERLVARGYGPDRPVDTNDTPEGRANNRRVEFVIQEIAQP